MKRIMNLSDCQVKILFEIIKNNMMLIGFEVKDDDFYVWSSNLIKNLKNPNYYLYSIDINNEIVGFFL